MSAICGLVQWDGRPVLADDLARMNDTLAAYGADGGGIWCEGPVGFGHRLSNSVPEDRFERQPLCDGANVLVADARIDNRDDLARGWASGAEAQGWPDSSLVARALDTWGAQAVEHLRGVFAFAHWDGRARRLLLARSPFGERPLFYTSSPRMFAFASMPKGLFALSAVARELDEVSLADFLAVERPDQSASFFRHVRRVPGGHMLIATDTGTRVEPFWRPDLIRELRLRSGEEYVEAFLEVYARAVRSAIRSSGRIGVMVSGGLDSSSVTALAAPMLAGRSERLAAFTEVPPAGWEGPIIAGRYADETPLVGALAARYTNVDLHLIRLADRFHLDDADARFAAAEAPFRLPLTLWLWDGLMASARQHDVRVMLNGQFGNFTVSYGGNSLLAQLIARGRWRSALDEARAMSRNGGRSALWTLVTSGIVPLLPPWVYDGLRRIQGPPAGAGGEEPLAAIHPAFAAAHHVTERARALGFDARRRPTRESRLSRAQVLPRLGSMLDGQLAGYAARFGIDVRDPTADTRVAEFCLSLPEEQFAHQGERRWLIRRAMAAHLPAAIVDNRRRGLQVADWCDRFQRHRSRVREQFDRIERSPLARRAIDIARLRRLVDQLPLIDSGNIDAMAAYRGGLDLGLEAGHFILWAEGAHEAGP